MRLTVRHVYDFGTEREVVGDDLVRPASWDALRTRTSGPFAMARDRTDLERMADEHPEIAARAAHVERLLAERGVRTLASYGVGGALLEFCLLRLRPGLRLVATDYGPETVARVRELLPQADVRHHDLLAEAPLDADLHLFHRIDSELTNAQAHAVFRRFGSQAVLLVATEVADAQRIFLELRYRLRNRNVSRAGWLRNRAAFESLFRATHDATRVRVGDLDGWLLEPRRSSGDRA